MIDNKIPFYKQLIRILLGLVFSYSAISKLISLDAFEIYVYSFGYLSLNTTFVLARVLIGFELFLGVWLVSGLYRKTAVVLSLASMVGFTFFIVGLLLQNNEEHCHCFGDAIEMSHGMSIAKNVVLSVLLLLVYKGSQYRFRFAMPLLVLLGVVGTALPFILLPPDTWMAEKYAEKSTYNEVKLNEYIEKNEMMEGEYVLCFYGTGCRFCKLSAKKVEVVKHQVKHPGRISYHFWGSDETVANFLEETRTTATNYFLVDANEFLKITDGKMPLIVVLKDGEVIEKYGYRDYQEQKVEDFLNKD